MSQPIIEVENLSKCYRLGVIGATSLRDSAARAWHRLRSGTPAPAEEFWALRDVSFTVQPGEVVGIIGRNGAGKSTLLKILSRITEPTSGRARLRGRVASLLEVGTGFHPELTGRENVFLNGAILGMSRAEVRRKFDEIVAFAEVDQFIDTPVKRYSSGMYVRLAFAVAAHLEPEILVIDEVLAVGDIAFQKKCLGKMESVSRQDGRTVLFVSHNMPAVAQLTQQAVLLKHGRVVFTGPTDEAVEQYLGESQDALVLEYDVSSTPRTYHGTGMVKFQRLWFPRSMPVFGPVENIRFGFRALAHASVQNMRISLTIFTADGQPVGTGFSINNLSLENGRESAWEVELPSLRLAPGHYYIGTAIGEGNPSSGHRDYDVVLDVLRFEMLPPEGESGTVGHWPKNWGPAVLSPVRVFPS